MASSKREAPLSETTEESDKKKAKVCEAEPSQWHLPSAPKRVVLNPADCDLDFNINGDGLQGFALHDHGFAYCWSGARANVGITGGKYCFGCRIVSPQPVDMEDTPLDQQNVCRVGISRGNENVGNLGETEHSFGFGGTGKFSNAGMFFDYGEKFGVGDTIVCAVNVESKSSAFITFSKNGKLFSIARHFSVVDSPNRKLDWAFALFPHVLLKNVIVELQFSPEDGLIPIEGYKPWSSALEDGNAAMGPTLLNLSHCEVMMMVGLPASGKSTWAEKWIKQHPEKRYVLLGTNLVLDRMKVPGLLRKHNYGERFEKLMDRSTAIFNILLSRAAKTPRNYIIDQTNVCKTARKRKLKPFADFWKVAVVVFPTPEELKSRADKRYQEMGKEIPTSALNEMLANYVLPKSKDMPGTDEYFDEVIFTELGRGGAQRYLDEMKRDLSSGASGAAHRVSAYSHANSIRSNVSPLPDSSTFPGYSPSGLVYEGKFQGSYLPQPTSMPMPRPPVTFSPQATSTPPPALKYDYQMPGQANFAYGGAPSGKMDSFSVVNQSPRMRSVTHVNDGVHDRLRNSCMGSGIVGPTVNADPYGAYAHGVYGSYPSPVAEPYTRPSYVEGSAFPTAGRSQFDMHAFGQSAFLSPRTSYGSPHAATPNPTYRNPPANPQPNTGYYPPQTRYY